MHKPVSKITPKNNFWINSWTNLIINLITFLEPRLKWKNVKKEWSVLQKMSRITYCGCLSWDCRTTEMRFGHFQPFFSLLNDTFYFFFLLFCFCYYLFRGWGRCSASNIAGYKLRQSTSVWKWILLDIGNYILFKEHHLKKLISASFLSMNHN